MTDPIIELAAALSPATAVKIASSLEIDGSLLKAIQKLPEGSTLMTPLAACHAELGPDPLASMLRGFAAAAKSHATDVRAVWSGPTFDGDGDHTTAALAHLIDEATEDVFASTYSATADSEFVKALWRAIARGVRTTLLVDTTLKNGLVAATLQSKLHGAQFWTYIPPKGLYGVQHSKVVIVDSRSAFVTSANLSRAAAERNIETGVIINDPAFASRVRQRFAKLRQTGAIVDLATRSTNG